MLSFFSDHNSSLPYSAPKEGWRQWGSQVQNSLCKFSQFSRSVVSDSVMSWTAGRQASLFISNSWSLLKLMSIESLMPSNHLILCRPLLLPLIFSSIKVFYNESVLRIRWPKYWSFSNSPSNEYSGLISGLIS